MYIVAPGSYGKATAGNWRLDERTKMMHPPLDKDGSIKNAIFIAKFGHTLMTLRNGPDRSGSGAKALVLGGTELAVFFDGSAAVGIVYSQCNMPAFLPGADADKRCSVRAVPGGIQRIFQEITENGT